MVNAEAADTADTGAEELYCVCRQPRRLPARPPARPPALPTARPLVYPPAMRPRTSRRMLA